MADIGLCWRSPTLDHRCREHERVSPDHVTTHASQGVGIRFIAGGATSAAAWPSGTAETFIYDAARRPSELRVRTAGGTTLATIGAAFDRVGNLTSESQVIAGQAGLAGNSTLVFSNVPLRRSTGYTIGGGSTVGYGYDANSNRLSAGPSPTRPSTPPAPA